MMGGDDGFANREAHAHAHARCLRRPKRVEHVLQIIRGDAASVIDDKEANRCAGRFGANRELPFPNVAVHRIG